MELKVAFFKDLDVNAVREAQSLIMKMKAEEAKTKARI